MHYQVKRSSRKTLALEIARTGEVVVRAPFRVSDRAIARFVEQHTAWITEKSAVVKSRAEEERLIDEREADLRKKAERILPPLVAQYSVRMGVKPASVKITSARTRFGSCGGNNAICFSWRLLAYPLAAVEYVVVHELAHIRHHNHSAAFYRLVEEYLPDYRERKKLLSLPGAAENTDR